MPVWASSHLVRSVRPPAVAGEYVLTRSGCAFTIVALTIATIVLALSGPDLNLIGRARKMLMGSFRSRCWLA